MILLLLAPLLPNAARADIPPGMTCSSEMMTIACFKAYEFGLLREHDAQIDAIAEKIAADYRRTDGDLSTYLLTGHASTFTGTADHIYQRNAWLRADTVADALGERLRHYYGLGRRKVSLLTLGASDSEPRPGLGYATQKERALQRRVDIVPIVGTPPEERVKPSCSPLNKRQIRNSVWAILGKKPRRFHVAKELWHFVEDGLDSKICKRILKEGVKRGDVIVAAEAYAACVWLDRYVAVIAEQFGSSSEETLGATIGATYAILDGPDAVVRTDRELRRMPAEQRDGFRLGYMNMRRHLAQLATSETTAEAFEHLMRRLQCKRDVRTQFTIIHNTIVELVLSEQGRDVFLASAGHCAYPPGSFNYPKVTAPNCGPVKQ
jgi:hypothetical protein